MKRFLFFACMAGIVCAFCLSMAFTIALVLIVFGAVAIFSPLIISTYRFNPQLLYMGDMEKDIIYILDRSEKSQGNKEWLSFDQIFSLAEALKPNKDLPRNGYYVALSNLVNKKMVEVGSKNGEHRYRLTVECIPKDCRELPCAA